MKQPVKEKERKLTRKPPSQKKRNRPPTLNGVTTPTQKYLHPEEILRQACVGGMQKTLAPIRGIRDPVHEFILVETDLEAELIDCPLFQRLRDVRQLSVAHMVFPSANGNRFEHSLGAMHLAGEYAHHLTSTWKDRDAAMKFRQLVRVAALLHDIAHGPYSHLWDRVVYSKIYQGVEKGHDEHRKYLLCHSHIKDILLKHNLPPEDVIHAWQSEPYHSIVQGKFGADVMDYMLRDQHHTGMGHMGAVSPKRIIFHSYLEYRFECDAVGQYQRLVACTLNYHKNVEEEQRRFREGRDYMYRCVYWHPRAQNFENFVERAIVRCMELGSDLVSMCMNMDQFRQLTETYLWSVFYRWAEKDLMVKELVDMMINRRKLKVVSSE